MNNELLATIESLRRHGNFFVDDDLAAHNAKVDTVLDAVTRMLEALEAVEAVIGRQWWARRGLSTTSGVEHLTSTEEGQ